MKKWGYDWCPHKVITDDGWTLTIFRVTGRFGKSYATKPENSWRMPVFAQHGAYDSAAGWAGSGIFDPTLPLQLVDQGFDVWFGNSRGNLYSNLHVDDATQSLAEHWDFTWADMGAYDLPAAVDKIIEVTGKPKVTMMGYSQGSAQMFYGLATNQDFFAERAERFVAIAPCIVAAVDFTYE